MILGVVDAASARLRDGHGLGSVPGSPHRGGTRSRLVPLRPDCFLDLLGIDDTTGSVGAWLEATLQGRDRVRWWCPGVDDLDDTAARRGLPIRSGQARHAQDVIVFRTAGMRQ